MQLCTPGMGVILSAESLVYETGSLQESSIPNAHSDWHPRDISLSVNAFDKLLGWR